ELRDAHHVIQDAAVRDLPGYQTELAPGTQLEGPSSARGTPHYEATQIQRQAGGGTYGPSAASPTRRSGWLALVKLRRELRSHEPTNTFKASGSQDPHPNPREPQVIMFDQEKLSRTLERLVGYLVRGDYAGAEALTQARRLNRSEIRQAIAEYGRHLV